MQEIDVFERFDYEHADENVAFVGAALRAGVKPVFKSVSEDYQKPLHTEIDSDDLKIESVISMNSNGASIAIVHEDDVVRMLG